jgi:mannose-6-phosphate isomerase-like protein (cupin superfamily)
MPLVEGGELALVYFQTDRLVFAASSLQPGQKSLRDPGHEGADEVAYCIRGEVVIELGEREGSFVRLGPGDALLIREGVPHTVYNLGAEPAEMTWCAAPSLGRTLIYDG